MKGSTGEGDYFNKRVILAEECRGGRLYFKSLAKPSSTSVCSALCAQDGPGVAPNWRVFSVFSHCSQLHGQVFVHQRETGFSSCSAISRRSFRRLPRCGCFRADLCWNCLAPGRGGGSHNHQWSNQDWKETVPWVIGHIQKTPRRNQELGLWSGSMFAFIFSWKDILSDLILPWEAATTSYAAHGLRSSKASTLPMSTWWSRTGTRVS